MPKIAIIAAALSLFAGSARAQSQTVVSDNGVTMKCTPGPCPELSIKVLPPRRVRRPPAAPPVAATPAPVDHHRLTVVRIADEPTAPAKPAPVATPTTSEVPPAPKALGHNAEIDARFQYVYLGVSGPVTGSIYEAGAAIRFPLPVWRRFHLFAGGSVGGDGGYYSTGSAYGGFGLVVAGDPSGDSRVAVTLDVAALYRGLGKATAHLSDMGGVRATLEFELRATSWFSFVASVGVEGGYIVAAQCDHLVRGGQANLLAAAGLRLGF